LDSKYHIIQYEELFQGSINSTSVYPRIIVKRALEHNAAAVIFAHNHPSGCPKPSMADKNLTKRLAEILAVIEVKVVDHFVIGANTAVSFQVMGLI
jgi:DNA repair protein RadC